MKTKKKSRLRAFAALITVTVLSPLSGEAQIYVPGGAVGTSVPAPFSGVGISSPKGMLEIAAQCVAGNQGSLVVTDISNISVCAAGTSNGEQIWARTPIVTSGGTTYQTNFVVKGVSGLTGVGIKNPKTQLDVNPVTAATHPFQVTGFNGATNIRVNNNGLVGINTSSPAEQLHVHEGILRLSGQNHSGGPMILLGGVQTSDPAQWGMEYAHSTSVPTLHGLNFWKPRGSNNFGNYFMFLADNGNVGINDDNPTSRLSVKGNTAISGNLRVGPQAASGAYAGYRLSVDGDMIAKRCYIQVSSWADYVFAPDYRLPELGEVEKFVQENKHLPGVPSEAEVKEKGIEMGDMNKVLLQKVEELTLYIIRQQKQIEALNAKLNQSK